MLKNLQSKLQDISALNQIWTLEKDLLTQRPDINDFYRRSIQDLKNLASGDFPAYNVYSDGNNKTLEIALAGYSKEDIQLYIEKDMLCLDASSKNKQDETIKYETRSLAFRKIQFRYNIVGYELKSTSFVDGLLTIKLSKLQEVSDRKVIKL